MKTLKDFKNFTNEKKVGDSGIGLDIKKEYTKIIDGGKGGTLDLGLVDAVSDTNIKNMEQEYPKGTVKVVDGHYIMSINENQAQENPIIVLNKEYSIDWGEKIIDFLERTYDVSIETIEYNDDNELMIYIDGSPEDTNECILYMDGSGIMNTSKSDVDIQ